jgi:hypothetical protein
MRRRGSAPAVRRVVDVQGQGRSCGRLDRELGSLEARARMGRKSAAENEELAQLKATATSAG